MDRWIEREEAKRGHLEIREKKERGCERERERGEKEKR